MSNNFFTFSANAKSVLDLTCKRFAAELSVVVSRPICLLRSEGVPTPYSITNHAAIPRALDSLWSLPDVNNSPLLKVKTFAHFRDDSIETYPVYGPPLPFLQNPVNKWVIPEYPTVRPGARMVFLPVAFLLSVLDQSLIGPAG